MEITVPFAYMLKMFMTRFLLLLVPFILVQAPVQAEPGISLDTPLEAIFQPSSWRDEQFAEICPNWSPTRPIRDFLTEKFYSECIPRPRYRGDDISLFERDLRTILAPHWLSLNMSNAEIALVESEPHHPLFMPIAMLDLNPYGVGLNVRANNLKHYGITLVRDFLIVYEVDTWKSIPFPNTGAKTFRAIKSAIDVKLAKTRQPLTTPSTETIQWLRLGRNAENENVRAACTTLLTSLGLDK